jgi:branched-chain amino acid transport system substrate-binding protein
MNRRTRSPADFGAAAKGMKVEIIAADHQNKADLASSIASSWFDVDKVDMILDGQSSSAGLAISEVARQKNKLFLASGPASSDMTGSKCNANTIQWAYDTWNLAHGTGKAMAANSWFFITADYAFGQAFERDTAAVIEANGGKVAGRVRHPEPAATPRRVAAGRTPRLI